VIRKNYRFKDEQGFEVGLRELFGDKDTLVTYFWMYGPQRERPCPMCTNWLGAVEGNAADIKQRVALKILGPLERRAAGRVRAGARLARPELRARRRRRLRRMTSACWRRRQRVPGARRVQARGDAGAAVLGQRDDERDGRPGPGPARRAGHRVALVDPRSDAGRPRHATGTRSCSIDARPARAQSSFASTTASPYGSLRRQSRCRRRRRACRSMTHTVPLAANVVRRARPRSRRSGRRR
jgi:hypothetical protein